MNIKYYLWLIVLILYIISPRDLLTPSLIDDLVALAALVYLTYKNRKKSQSTYRYEENQYSQTDSNKRQSGEQRKQNTRHGYENMTLHDAYKILGIDSTASLEEIKKAYKDKIIKNHPDKVSHLSVELQEKARQLTVEINRAYELIKEKHNVN